MYKINQYVKLKNSSLFGKILNIKINKNKIIYKIKINDKITFIDEDLIEKELFISEKKDNIKVNVSLLDSNFCNELMIRHLTKSEALIEIERFIDKALSKNIKIIKIIHGKNGGILRKVTHEYLDNCPFVSEFRLGYPHEGSYGVTIVILK